MPYGGAFPFLVGLLNFNVFPPVGSARHCGERLTRDTSFCPELWPGAVAGFFICPDATVSDATLRLRHLFLGHYPEVLYDSLQGHRWDFRIPTTSGKENPCPLFHIFPLHVKLCEGHLDVFRNFIPLFHKHVSIFSQAKFLLIGFCLFFVLVLLHLDNTS